jgi:hypothetical protein
MTCGSGYIIAPVWAGAFDREGPSLRAKYICERCGRVLFTVPPHHLDIERLGLLALTPEQREGIMTLDSNRAELIVRLACDDCTTEGPEVPIDLVHG